jgi:hypothetical protein
MKRRLSRVGEEDGENVADENVRGIRRSGRERSIVERYVPTLVQSKRTSERHRQASARFHITPMNEWQWLVKKMNFRMRNTLEWRTGCPLPRPPAPCWLLPCKDDTAVEIAKHRDDLRAAGWKLLTCEPHVVSRIGNKANLHAYATELGLLEHLPQHYVTPETATYPCMLKAAVGEHGRDVFIVDSADDVAQKAVGGFACGHWLLQELCAGNNEYATSLLVYDGEVLDAISTNYVYDKDIYVWPYVEEDQDQRRSTSDVPAKHLETMTKFLAGFSGVCNFNYKVRPSGGMCIFEVNARVGADLACDVPRRRAAQFF